MKTLIVYETKYGTTEKCALRVKEKLEGKVHVCNLKDNKINNLNDYDSIIVGGSIYMGQIQKNIKAFCENNLSLLKSKKLGLFICCMDAKNLEKQMETSFSQELRDVAVAKEIFGGEYLMGKMNFIYKFIIKKISGSSESVSKISFESIDKFTKQMNGD